MNKQDKLQQETMKRFHSVSRSRSDFKPSKTMIKRMDCKKRIELIEEAKALGCSIDELK